MNKEQKLIYSILEKLEVNNDSVLIIHSAFSGLSRSGYRAEPLIKSVLDYLNHGTLLMPTMTWRTVSPQQPVWNEIYTPSHTGILSEIFRTEFSSHRSLHPTHSVSGCGVAAEYLLSGHHLGNTPVPVTSPYGLMRDFRSYILLLGVGYESCTAIHHPEETIAPEVYVKSISDIENYTLITRRGEKISYNLRRHKKLNRNFEKYRPEGNSGKSYASFTVGNISYSLLELSALMEQIHDLLMRDKMGNLG